MFGFLLHYKNLLTLPMGLKKLQPQIWSCRGSIPVPLTCKASALPFELQPHTAETLEQFNQTLYIASATENNLWSLQTSAFYIRYNLCLVQKEKKGKD